MTSQAAHPSLTRYAILGILTLAFLYAWATGLNPARDSGKPWVSPVITQEERQALQWVLEHTRERDTFAADIFGSEQLMGQTLRLGTEGGDWAIIPNVVERMSAFDQFFSATDARKAWQTAVRYNASYVWAPNRQVYAGYGWKPINRTTLSDERYFTRVFLNQTRGEPMEIYRVNPVTP
jgi:hypothetical protein